MGRQLRIKYPGAIYQVMNRGDHHKKIVRDDQDRNLFLKTVGEACEARFSELIALGSTAVRLFVYGFFGNRPTNSCETASFG
jgi:hypothetical protein